MRQTPLLATDEQFGAAKAKLGGRKRSTAGAARSAELIRCFTGHLYCKHCGSAFYSRKSENRKGVYVYYNVAAGNAADLMLAPIPSRSARTS